ncbi:MAG: multicopper oxidase domain-containing protein, partial [Chloroflexota bacterium]|nr:multicopper oxidase domain-containing protein [Chloroflexota bacterium]
MTSTQTRWSRRDFLKYAAASAGVAAVGVSAPTIVLGAKGGGGGTVSRNPLRIPPIASPSGLTLTAAPTGVSKVLAYNGQFPGPTLVASRGDAARVGLANGLSGETTIHWHGMIVPEAADGHPKYAVAPGGSYSYSFTVSQRACLNWYHPHPHMMTGHQVYYGLAGAFIVRDSEEGGLGLPSGAYEVPLIVRDASYDSQGNLSFGAKASGFLGTVPLVNGTRDPYLAVDRGVYRLRVLNGANARVFRLALSSGAAFTLISNDGGLLPSPVSVTEITPGPAERADLLVDFRGLGQGATVRL